MKGAILTFFYQLALISTLFVLILKVSEFDRIMRIPDLLENEHYFLKKDGNTATPEFPKTNPKKIPGLRLFNNADPKKTSFMIQLEKILEGVYALDEDDHFTLRVLNEKMRKITQSNSREVDDYLAVTLKHPESHSMKVLFFLLNAYSRFHKNPTPLLIGFLKEKHLSTKKKLQLDKVFYFPGGRMDILKIQVISLFQKKYFKDKLSEDQLADLKITLGNIVRKDDNLALVREAVLALSKIPDTKKMILKLSKRRKKRDRVVFQGLL